MEWTEGGVAGAYRFTQRVFRLVEGLDPAAPARPDALGEAARALRRVTHRTIAAVSEALDSFAFNVAVARLYELANAITDAERANDPAEAGLAMGAPRGRGNAGPPDRADDAAPRRGDACPAAARARSASLPNCPGRRRSPICWSPTRVTIAVQVMGRLRGTIAVAPDAPADTVIAAAEAEPNVARALAGKRVVRRIHVPNRIVNFVVAG